MGAYPHLPASVLAAFGAVEPCSLGGRLRKRWRVRRGGEEWVLTRHEVPQASVRYEIRALQAAYEAGWPVPLPVETPVLLEGRLCTVVEFHRAWRGKHDAVVHAYDEVLPLKPEEWAILTPVWWLFLVDLWARNTPDDGWILGKLMQRSPLMGPDRDAFP